MKWPINIAASCCLFLSVIFFVTTCNRRTNTTSVFVRVENGAVVVGEAATSLMLRGVNIDASNLVPPGGGNWVYDGFGVDYPSADTYIPVVLDSEYYTETHFQTAASIGFNCIRVQLTYRLFEDNSDPGNYKQAGWDYLDQLISWGKSHNLYLILSMATPQGGYQPEGGGTTLWTSSDAQTRLANLWAAIANRYSGEVQIAAYDLVNEPTPTPNSSGQSPFGAEKWEDLSRTLIEAIRAVDSNHMIILEMVNWLNDGNGNSNLSGWSREVLDAFQFNAVDSSGNAYSNILYDFHFYDPGSYVLATIQGQSPSPSTFPSSSTLTTIDGDSYPFNSTYLEAALTSYAQFQRNQGFPFHIGEWSGSVFYDTSGGADYVSAVLCALDSLGAHWSHYVLNNFYTDGTLSTTVASRMEIFSNYFSDVSSACSS